MQSRTEGGDGLEFEVSFVGDIAREVIKGGGFKVFTICLMRWRWYQMRISEVTADQIVYVLKSQQCATGSHIQI